jgi:hypothetical protein
MRKKWEEELKAAVEAEYRRQRGDFLLALQWWLRDVWEQTLEKGQRLKAEGQSPTPEAVSMEFQSEAVAADPRAIHNPLSTINSFEALLAFPQLAGTKRVAQRLTPQSAMENLRIIEQLQRWLHTNVQEALALEVGLLKLQL